MDGTIEVPSAIFRNSLFVSFILRCVLKIKLVELCPEQECRGVSEGPTQRHSVLDCGSAAVLAREFSRCCRWVFGFTEDARVANRESEAETVRSAVVNGEGAFWSSIPQTLGNEASTEVLRNSRENFA